MDNLWQPRVGSKRSVVSGGPNKGQAYYSIKKSDGSFAYFEWENPEMREKNRKNFEARQPSSQEAAPIKRSSTNLAQILPPIQDRSDRALESALDALEDRLFQRVNKAIADVESNILISIASAEERLTRAIEDGLFQAERRLTKLLVKSDASTRSSLATTEDRIVQSLDEKVSNMQKSLGDLVRTTSTIGQARTADLVVEAIVVEGGEVEEEDDRVLEDVEIEEALDGALEKLSGKKRKYESPENVKGVVKKNNNKFF
jgi:hypothetical protein